MNRSIDMRSRIPYPDKKREISFYGRYVIKSKLRKIRVRTKFLTIFWIVTIFLGFALQPLMVFLRAHETYVGTIYSKYSTDAPILDGTIGASEWEDANAYMDVGDYGRFDVYLMHGENYFYIGVRVNDPTEGLNDNIQIQFDEGDDGSYGSGSGDGVLTDNQEDWKCIWENGTIGDGWRDTYDSTSSFWYYSDAPQEAVNFEAAIDYHANRWEAEFKIPFVGNDGHTWDKSDLNIARDDVVGISFEFMNPHYTYPEDFNDNDASTYLALRFETARVTILGMDPLMFYAIIAVSAVAIVGVVIFFLRGRKPKEIPAVPPPPKPPAKPPVEKKVLLLEELEEMYRSGKITETAYRRLKKKYKAEADSEEKTK